MVKAVIFDLDDTLISEKQYIDSGYHHIAKLLSNRINKSEEELFELLKKLLCEGSKNVFNRLFDKLGFSYTKDTIMELVEEYRNHYPIIEFYEDTLQCLRYLKENGIKVGIITDGYGNAQRQKLNAVRAYDYFDNIIVTDDMGREYWKPHSKAFEAMRDTMNIEFNEMIYLGDNPEKDFYISKIYPIKTVRITREDCLYKDRKYLENIHEDYSISNLEEIKQILF